MSEIYLPDMFPPLADKGDVKADVDPGTNLGKIRWLKPAPTLRRRPKEPNRVTPTKHPSFVQKMLDE